MANDIDRPPVDDELTRKNKDYLSDKFSEWMTTFYETLVGYLSQNGVFIPRLTTAQRGLIKNPQEGQMIYNTTLAAPQIWQAGVWKTFTTV